LVRTGLHTVTCWVVVSLLPSQERFVVDAYSWWHDNGWKSFQNTLFDGERGQITTLRPMKFVVVGLRCDRWAG
jgi:hypothetical protein